MLCLLLHLWSPIGWYILICPTQRLLWTTTINVAMTNYWRLHSRIESLIKALLSDIFLLTILLTLERLWRYLSNHYFVSFFLADLFQIANNNWRRNNCTTDWISEANYLTEWRKLQSKRQCVKHFLYAHLVRNQDLHDILSKSRFKWNMHLKFEI